MNILAEDNITITSQKQVYGMADDAQDTADSKRRVFIAQPTPPYDVGDLWCAGSTGDILTCTTAKADGQGYASGDWSKLNKYTDDTALTSFLSGTYATDKATLEGLIDGKAETWYQSSDPSTGWTTAQKASHEGDLWYKTTDKTTWYWSGSAWQQQDVPTAVFDLIDGKAQVFTSTPTVPYSVGDLWFNSATSDIMTCTTARSTGSYTASDWQKRNKYTDDAAAMAYTDAAVENLVPMSGHAEGAIASFDDLLIKDLVTDIDPVQDLNGYSKPWVGGAGKNKLPMNVAQIKTLNTGGTWSGNTYTQNGVSFELKTNSAGAVTSIVATGTASAETVLAIVNSIGGLNLTDNTQYAISAFTSGQGGSTTYELQTRQNNTWRQVNNANGNTMTYVANTSTNDLVRCIIRSGYEIPSGGLTFYPMIRLSSVNDATFEPYTNICPISGFTTASISRTGINVCDEVFEAGGLNGVSGQPAVLANRVRTKNFNPCVGGESYYIYCGTEVSCRVFWYDKDKNFISRTGNVRFTTVVAPYNAYFFKINTEGTEYGEVYKNDISLNYDWGENLFDGVYPSITSTVQYRSISVGKGMFTMSSDIPIVSSTANLFFLAGQVSSGASSSTNGVGKGTPRTVITTDGYVTIGYRSTGGANTFNPADFDVYIRKVGKNLMPCATSGTQSGVTYTPQSDGSVVATGTASSNDTIYYSTASYVTLPAGSYKVSTGQSDNNYRVRIGKGTNGTTLVAQAAGSTDDSFTLTEATTIRVGLRVQNLNGQVVSATFRPMVRLSAEDSTYEQGPSHYPYQGNVYSVNLNGTVYSGTLDVTTGGLTVTTESITFDGSDDEGWNGTATDSGTGIQRFYTTKSYAPDYSIVACDSYVIGTATSAITQYTDNIIIWDSGRVGLSPLWAQGMTLAQFKTGLASHPFQIVKKLATPLTYQLSPTQIATLIGRNNIWSDTGSVSINLTAIRDDIEKIEEVTKLANDTAQYFWVDETGTDTGAHITEVSKEEWNDSTSPNYHKGGNLLARSNGIAVRDGLDELASFGSNGTTIGRTDSCHMEITPNSMTLLDAEGRKQMTANLLNDQATGLAIINYTLRAPYVDGTTATFTTSFLINEILESYDVTTGDPVTVTKTGDREITFAVAPQASSITRVRYNTPDPVYDFGLGTRTDGATRGSDSIVIGNDNEASSYLCIAIGAKNKVNSNQAIGIGRHIIASSHDQIAMGRWNVEDNQNEYGFIFGNGTADNARSNALAIGWNGDIHLGRAGALFSTTVATTATLTINGMSNLSGQTLTVTNAGYVPLGIVGTRCNYTSGQTGARNIYLCYLSSRSLGSATITYAVRNLDSAQNKGDIQFYILWVRADAV